MDKRVVEAPKINRSRRLLQAHLELLCEGRKILHLKNVNLKDVVDWDAPRFWRKLRKKHGRDRVKLLGEEENKLKANCQRKQRK